jgi:hypothetical protein
MQPGRFTELFFLDEATAFAAGHRPCALCRREDYDAFARSWQRLHPAQVGADAMDAQLHEERLDPLTRRHRTHDASLDELPNGSFVLTDGEPWLVHDDELRRWTPAGYAERRPRASGRRVEVITPPSLVEILRTDRLPLVPFLHPSADRARRPRSRGTRSTRS